MSDWEEVDNVTKPYGMSNKSPEQLTTLEKNLHTVFYLDYVHVYQGPKVGNTMECQDTEHCHTKQSAIQNIVLGSQYFVHKTY